MTDAGLGAALERLERGAALPDDAATVRAAIAGAGIGAGAVKVGRDANGATIQTDVRIGDNCYHLSLTPELLEALQPTPPASTPFNLPDPPREFVGRIEEEVLLLETLSRGQQGAGDRRRARDRRASASRRWRQGSRGSSRCNFPTPGSRSTLGERTRRR